ncbi:(-)-beta-caryophyllene synthase [Actinosynnema sp. NPDC047251]|uniref:(-)-beta-caryophyllene synthase ((2E,6E)-farnesyl diphosphate cyclizing) n=1 Tax=Saccharothrix espanaensis (strain ATCC 51144 / DSM 44229 / JCM 9112 / NBRC 15066 / NRRL 15764) TaxID=1179773 RepID=BCAS_SACES|nr:(-)-beta-caryophyllene synthase [Saccharothrix espanaensis]K0K750.1 RecName: Full=(-)-beta-caryophyllene synthase ((2E,6E)-farnesyl diphosphate cyclizing); AltName: Full=Beta-caryophyllene synthase; AltName: Full=Terpene synthase; AltName: Full=Type I terpene cyclase [Saccharothrix espanaensis DSM 44229]CCH32724.1 Pentalenene synthase [Saccharothrix espanaensis DSM 44229]
MGRPATPQQTAFHIPFPRAISPDVSAVHPGSMAWLRRHGMLRSDASARRVDGWRLTELAGRFFPDARGEDLRLGADVMGFFFLFDDQFDHPGGLRAEAVAVSKRLLHLTSLPAGPAPEGAGPVVAAWADLWNRSCQGMSSAWRVRAAREWRRYFVGNLEESVAREGMSGESVEDYLRLRAMTIGTTPVYDLCERTQHFEIPDEVLHSHHVQAMRDLATEIVVLCNDVASTIKESARGETLNAVLLLERHHEAERGPAVARVQRMVEARLAAFRRLRDRTSRTCAALDLTAEQCDRVDRYVRTALMSVVRGNYDWQQRSARFSADDARPGSLPGYLDDLVGHSGVVGPPPVDGS